MRRMQTAAAGVLGSPFRNLLSILIFVGLVFVGATAAYVHAGWSLADASYMVTLTIYTVGYGEVRPIDTPYLHVVTMATMALGCTGMILLTSALVQVFTLIQFRQMFGADRMQKQIDQLTDHVVICGFGRIGVMLAKDLAAAKRPFVVLEQGAARIAEAEALDFLCIAGDATQEAALRDAGIERAQVLATVLPDDAANVFITLSARQLNPNLQIIARGEAPTTESKLLYAGADKVVLPTHIGAERIAELILYPQTTHFIGESERLRETERGLHDLGLELEVVTAIERGAMTGLTVIEAERRGGGAFFIVQINRKAGKVLIRPPGDARIEGGDNVALVLRGNSVAAAALFAAPGEGIRAGRMTFKPQ